MKRFDMHVHTSGASFCSEVSGKMAAAAYKAKNYDGIVLTNHYAIRHFDYFGYDYESAIRNYLDEFKRVQKVFMKAGMTAVLGAEVEIIGNGAFSEVSKSHEFLLYGITEQFLTDNPKLYAMSQAELYKLCHDNQILVYQSHPFRSEQGHFPADPEFLDGVEFNTHFHFKRNYDKVLEFADKYGLGLVAGSDMHSSIQAGDAATFFPDGVYNATDIAVYLSDTSRPQLHYINPPAERKSV